jgi:hypothetical protein
MKCQGFRCSMARASFLSMIARLYGCIFALLFYLTV